MNENQLIRQLKELREIKPREEWVLSAKNRIFAEETFEVKPGLISFFPLFRYKLALAPIISVLIVIGLFGFTQNTLPGDLLFSVKKMTETAQITFSSVVEKPKTQLKLANKRLEELGRIAESNQVKSLDPAIKEFQASIVQATKDLNEMDLNVTSSDPMVIKELMAESKKLAENKEKVEFVLGTIIGNTEELTSALNQLEKQTASYLIADLERRTLTLESEELLAQAKQDFEEGKYSQSLEKIWILSNY